MSLRFVAPGLEDIAAKVDAGLRISDDDALRLFKNPDLLTAGSLADGIRRRRSGNKAYYILNHHINYSNVCTATCDFCAFYRRKGEPGAWDYSQEDMERIAREASEAGASEIHMVGGLHPDYSLDTYETLLRRLKAAAPRVHIKAFTAVEISWFARRARLPALAVLERLKQAGLDSLPGGGSEIFHPDVFDLVVKGKDGAEAWFDVHRTWHGMGGRSTATMLYGHVEAFEHRVDHLRRLRELQDETRGFLTFIPLAFHPANTALSELPGPSGFDDLKTLAISRIYLDNFDHIKAYWPMLGHRLAQAALSFGADDMDGTVEQERIYHMAGAETPQGLAEKDLVRLITEAGFVPVKRDSLYGEARPVEKIGMLNVEI